MRNHRRETVKETSGARLNAERQDQRQKAMPPAPTLPPFLLSPHTSWFGALCKYAPDWRSPGRQMVRKNLCSLAHSGQPG